MQRPILLAILPALVLANVETDPNNHWSGAFQAKPCFNINKDITSWTLHLQFEQPVASIECWTAVVKSTNADKTEYILTNQPYNGVQHVGDELCIDFIGHGSGNINPHITAFIEELPDGGGHQVVSHAPVTHRVTQSLAPGETRPPTTPISVHVPSGSGCSVGSLSVSQDWGERFEATLEFPGLSEDVVGWMANVTFSTPVTKIDMQYGDPIYTSPDQRTWVLVNHKDRPFFDAGTSVDLKFFGNYRGDSAPDAQAVLCNMGVDRDWDVTCPPNKMSSKYNYDCVLMESIMFYAAQRSGKLPADNPIPWRDDSALDDHGDNGEDLSGGWYDAGDHVKFNFPMAYTTVVLNWGLLEFKDAYVDSGLLDEMYDCVKWPLDYLLKCHVADDVLYVQVGDGNRDHSYWGPPEKMTMPRPAYKIDSAHPGCDVAMETAAAFASGSMVFKSKDHAYSAKLLDHAKTLWEFAVDSPHVKYSESVGAAAGFYPSYNFTDEMCWGSMWLYKATGEQKYLDEAKKWFDPEPDWGMSWDDKVVGCQLLLYEATREDKYKQAVIGTFTDWLPGGKITYTPQGLAWRLQWASLRYASNMAMAALMAAKDGINPVDYRHWAMCQIHYALGDTGFSYVVGFGDRGWPLRAHHRGASCPNDPSPCGPQIMSSNKPNVHTLYGALVGGPDQGDGYKDQRSNYVSNEVACDYNAGFQTAVAGKKS
ncbi:hypothetical protein BaRGS_00035989 [Batillaria attramentaria]|uniref:Endoglucanase n=1 Tax=Batillaria attramentaria TaxID=370345 RepID=A0ABD0JD87_9CAEN